MTSAGLLLLAASAVGIDYGWQPVAGGGFEYIVQIDPAALEAFANGEDIISELPPSLRGIRRYRVRVGTDELPHRGEPPPVINTPPTSSTPGPYFPSAGTSYSPLAPNSPASGLPSYGSDPNGGWTGQGPRAPATVVSAGTASGGATGDPAAQNRAAPSELTQASIVGDLSKGTFTTLILWCSFAGNFYLGWALYAFRERVRFILRRQIPA